MRVGEVQVVDVYLLRLRWRRRRRRRSDEGTLHGPEFTHLTFTTYPPYPVDHMKARLRA